MRSASYADDHTWYYIHSFAGPVFNSMGLATNILVLVDVDIHQVLKMQMGIKVSPNPRYTSQYVIKKQQNV